MKRTVLLSIFTVFFASAAFGQATNDFYDDTPSKTLPGSLKIEVAGEMVNPGVVDLGEGQDGGKYKLFPAADFFSDPALKAVSAVHFLTY
jgi:hypothetical protein